MFLEKVMDMTEGRIPNTKETKEWDKYWKKDKSNSLMNYLANTYRKIFLSLPMKKMMDAYFAKDGKFLEAGSGSATDTYYYNKEQRYMVALDLSREALKVASKQKNIDEVRQGDIRNLPFKANSLDGIWNLGVMEHLSTEDIDSTLAEFHRVLNRNGRIILLWPAKYNLINIFFSFMFPAMPNELKSTKQGKEILEKNKFKCLKTKITVMGDIILVGQKKD